MGNILVFIRQRWRMISLSAVALILAVVCIWIYADYLKPPPSGAYFGKKMVLKCTNCGQVARYTLGEIRAMISGPEDLGSPLVVNCDQCGQKTLTQGVECPNCGEVFIVIPGQSDLCPQCGMSYVRTLREKHLQEQ